MEREIISVLFNDEYYEELEDVIQYMIEEDYPEEHIVGKLVEFCVSERVYGDKEYDKIADILFSNLDIFEGDYFEKSANYILDKVSAVKYYNPIQKYIITKEDYDKVLENL